MQTKEQKTQTQAMESVSKALPSLMRSSKVQQKAAKVGFDWSNAEDALAKLYEECDELKEAVSRVIPIISMKNSEMFFSLR